MNTENQQWGSRIGYILATIGMAFGLGAIWRFPYVVAESGGGAFVLIFTDNGYIYIRNT